MFSIIAAIVAYIGWGVGDVFSAVTARRLNNSLSFVFWGMVLSVIISTIVVPFTLSDLQNLNAGILFLNIVLSLTFIIGLVTFSEAFILANPSIVGTIASGYVALVVLFSLFFLKEKISTVQGVAIIITFIGLFLTMADFKKFVQKKFLLNRGVFLALVSMFTWAVYFTFIKIPVKSIGWFWPHYFTFLLFPLLYVFIKFRGIKLVKPNINHALPPFIITEILSRIAEFSFNIGINKGLTSIVAPIAGSYPTLFVILSTFIFKEPIKKQQIGGIILTLTGIVFLAFAS